LTAAGKETPFDNVRGVFGLTPSVRQAILPRRIQSGVQGRCDDRACPALLGGTVSVRARGSPR
jgi:hypothetical protein